MSLIGEGGGWQTYCTSSETHVRGNHCLHAKEYV